MQAAAAAATAATAAGRDAMGPAVVEEEEDAEELIEQQLEASMRRRQALAEYIQDLRAREAAARAGSCQEAGSRQSWHRTCRLCLG